MSEIRKLDKPPIKEAVIEFQFQPSLEFEEDSLKEIVEQLKSNYEKHDFIRSKAISFKIGLDQQSKIAPELPTQLQGLLLTDFERDFIVNFQRGRLSISKVKSYSNFEDLTEEAFAIYDALEDYLKGKTISRIAVRYINEISFKNDYKNIFEKPPLSDFHNKIQGLQTFYNQNVFEHSDNEGSVVNLHINLKEKKVVVDIDSFNTILQDSADRVALKEVLSNLRKQKNSIFFDIVSDRFEKEN